MKEIVATITKKYLAAEIDEIRKIKGAFLYIYKE